MGKKNKGKKKRNKSTISRGTQPQLNNIKDTDDEDSSAENDQITSLKIERKDSSLSDAPTPSDYVATPSDSIVTDSSSATLVPIERFSTPAETPIETMATPLEFFPETSFEVAPKILVASLPLLPEEPSPAFRDSTFPDDDSTSDPKSNKLTINTSISDTDNGPKTSPATLFKEISVIIDTLDEISKLPEEKLTSPTIKLVSKYSSFVSLVDECGIKSETLDSIKQDLERISILCQSDLSRSEKDEFLMKILDLMESSQTIQSEIHEQENGANYEEYDQPEEAHDLEVEDQEEIHEDFQKRSPFLEKEEEEKLRLVITSLMSENRALKENLDSANERIEYLQIRELENVMAREQEIEKRNEEEEEEEQQEKNYGTRVESEEERDDDEEEDEEEEEDTEAKTLALLSKEEIISKFLSLSKTNDKLLGKLVVHSPRIEKSGNLLSEIDSLNGKIKELENEKRVLEETIQKNKEDSSKEIQQLQSNLHEGGKSAQVVEDLKKSLEKEKEKFSSEILELKKLHSEEKAILQKKFDEILSCNNEFEKQIDDLEEQFQDLEKQKKAVEGDLEILRLFTNSEYKGQPQIKKLFEEFMDLTRLKIRSQMQLLISTIADSIGKIKDNDVELAGQLTTLREMIKSNSSAFDVIEIVFIEAKVLVDEMLKRNAALQREIESLREKKTPPPDRRASDVSSKDSKNTEWRPSQPRARTALSSIFISPDEVKDGAQEQEFVPTPVVVQPPKEKELRESRELKVETKDDKTAKDIKRSSSDLKKVMTPEEERVKRVVILQRMWREKLKKRESIRYHIAMEVLDTETNYVNQLRALRECMDLFREKLGTLITQETFDDIFPAILPIIEVNEQIQASLKERIEKWESSRRVADIFEANAKKLSIYTHYVNNYNKALTALHNAQKNPAFVQFSQELQTKKLFRLSISDILITPIQRIPRYVLLLEQILKKTSKSHPDYLPLKRAIETLKNTATEINKKKAVIEIQERLVNFPQQLGELVQEERVVEYEGDILEKTTNGYKPRTLIMFNDMIIGTKEGASMTKISGTSKISISTLEFKWAFFFPVISLDTGHKAEKVGTIDFFPMILSGVSDKPNEKKTLATTVERDRQLWSEHFKKTRDLAAIATARTASSDWMAISRQNSRKTGPTIFKKNSEKRNENRFSTDYSERRDSLIREREKDKDKEKEKEKERSLRRQSEIIVSSDSTATV